MIFGGLQKNSFIDYPGKISCVLFLSGCNFECPYCHNPELACGDASRPSRLDEKTVFEFLETRIGFLDGVVISGGEPTIHKDLPFLCKKIKQMGFPLKLDTNGSRPLVLKRIIEDGLADYVAMDVKTHPQHYAPLLKGECHPVNLYRSIGIIMASAPDYEFRTTCVKPFVDVPIIERISKIIEGARLYALQRFNGSRVMRPDFFYGSEGDYGDEDLLHLKSIADPWVQQCIIR